MAVFPSDGSMIRSSSRSCSGSLWLRKRDSDFRRSPPLVLKNRGS